MASRGDCPLCGSEMDGETVVIGEKGAEGINKSSIDRGDSIAVVAGTEVHKRCRVSYINKKQIYLFKKAKLQPPQPVKRSARVSVGPFNSKSHCLFCGNEINHPVVTILMNSAVSKQIHSWRQPSHIVRIVMMTGHSLFVVE